MFIFLLVHVDKGKIKTNKFTGNEDQIRLMSVLNKSQNARYRYFVATELIPKHLFPSNWVGKR